MCVVYMCVCVCEGRWRSGVCGGRRKEIMCVCVHMHVCGWVWMGVDVWMCGWVWIYVRRREEKVCE